MRKNLLAILLLSCLICFSCSTTPAKTDIEAIKKEIVKAEKDFETMAAEKGVAEAFSFFADSNAVIKRQNDSLIHGKEGIRNYYSNPNYKNAIAKWAPDFVDVSVNGDLAYTYGKYTWEFKDSAMKSSFYSGVFHTVWKKQGDGNWKYVWD
jgi:ketosteroid isomerase-like protein